MAASTAVISASKACTMPVLRLTLLMIGGHRRVAVIQGGIEHLRPEQIPTQ
jgi:hypothetical protein